MLKTKDGYAKVIGTSYQGSSDYLLLSNGDSKAISSLSVNYATSAGNADTVDGYHASSLVKFYLSPMANDAPADSAKSWFINTMPSASGAIVYNVPGVEKTIIAGKSSGAYGHMLQLNYQDTYLRVLRYYNGSWKSTDWEKISAGYADSAGSVAWANVTGKPSSLKNPYSLNVFGVTYDGSAVKVVSPSNFISQVNEVTSTVTDGTMFITSWASDSGFADTNAINVPYKRKAIHLWEYIKAKTDSLYTTKVHNHDDRYLKLTGGTMQLGEGLKFHADENYFGTDLDARIISLLDGNDKVCDGGLIIDERATLDGKEYVTELLRIRDSEFKWKGSNILHNGNSHINGNTITINGSSLTVSKSDHTHSIYAVNENYGGFTKLGRLPISGFYQSNESKSGGNAPWSSWVHLINCQHSTTSNNYALQIAASFFDNNTFKIRVTNNSVNNAWRDIIHSGNIGSQLVKGAYMTPLTLDTQKLISSGYLASDYTNRNDTVEYMKAAAKYLQKNYPGYSVFGTMVPNVTGFFTANIYTHGFNSNGNPEHITIHYYPHGGNIINCGTTYGSWYYYAINRDGSSYKLQTARKIWGQSFDGTADISGTLSGVAHIQFSADNTYNIGSNSAASKYIYTYWLGSKSGQKLELGANNSGYGQGLCIDTNLNVGIGTNTPAYKLDVKGDIRATGQIIRESSGQTWVNGRRGALLREITSTGYHTLWSLKTTNGSWDFGEYNSSGWNNIPVLSYITDTNFNSSNNTTTYQIKFPLDSGTIALTKNIPTSLKNPYSLTLKANGTTLATYDGSVSKIVNLTYDNVGAAAKNHTHNSLEPWASYITGDSHATALKSIFDKNKTSIPRNKFISMLSSAYANTSYYMGYFLYGYENAPYGGFFVAHYDTAYYIGISNGSFAQHRLVYSTDIPNSLKNPHALTISLNGTSQGPYDGSAAKSINITPSSIGAATSNHTHSWTSITDKLVAGNEFNIVNAGFNSDMWFNYLPIDNRNGSAAISQYVMGNGNKGLASVYAYRFKVDGQSCMWKDARNYAPFYATFNGGFEPILDIKTKGGDWSIGSYDVFGNYLVFAFTSDSDFNAGVNGTAQYYITTSGTFSGASRYINHTPGDPQSYMYSTSTGTYGGAIQIREVNEVLNNQSAWGYAPRITFHWGQRYAKGFGMRSDGQFAVDDVPIALTSNVLTFDNDNADYLGANFNNPDFSKKAASKYIECWDGAGGWWNWMAGKFMKAGSSDAYVLLGGGGHKPLSEFSTNTANVADTIKIWEHESNDAWYYVTWTTQNGTGYGSIYESTASLQYNPSQKTLWTGGGLWASQYVKAASIRLENTNEINSYSGDLYLNHRNTASGSEGHTANIKMCGTGGSVIIGANDVPSYQLDVRGNVIASSWLRTRGNSGWYSESYGGGIYMTDTSWIRTYGGKPFYCDNQIYSSQSIKMGNILLEHTDEINNSANGGLHLNYRNTGNVTLCNGGGAVTIGTTSTDIGGNKLYVNGSEFINGASNVKDHVFANGFRHRSHNSNDSVLLAGGGYSQGVPVKYWSIENIIIDSPTDAIKITRGGNYTFITKIEPRIKGSCTLTLQFPSGYSEDNTIIWAIGNINDEASNSSNSSIYATIVHFQGSKYYLNLADDSTLNNGSCQLYFMCF